MEAVKLKKNYQQALLLLSNLQQHPATHERALSNFFLLVRLCYSIQKTAVTLHDKDSGSIWQKRAANLHGDLTSATAQFLQSADQSGEQFWDGCLRLLYVGAEACAQLESEKNSVVTQLAAQKEYNGRLEKEVQVQHEKIEGGVKEITDLRSKIAVQEQFMEPLEISHRESHARLEIAIRDNYSLAVEKENLAEERTRNLQILERQAKAIEQLMKRCENDAREKSEALKSRDSFEEDNHTLRVNLGQHGQVIENLININAEMMDTANYYALQLEHKNLLEQAKADAQSPLVDSNQLEEKRSGAENRSLDALDLQIKPTKLLQSEDKHVESNPPKIILGLSEDLFNRRKGKTFSSDELQTLSTTERLTDANRSRKPAENSSEEDQGRSEQKKKIAGTSDMLIPERQSTSLEDLPAFEERTVCSSGSASLDNLRDLEEKASSDDLSSSSSRSLFEKWDRRMGGRLQVVGGKAKGFLEFVAGADLAPPESF